MKLPAFLTKSYGPLPGWAWLAGIGGGIALRLRSRRLAAEEPTEEETLPAVPGLPSGALGPSTGEFSPDPLFESPLPRPPRTDTVVVDIRVPQANLVAPKPPGVVPAPPRNLVTRRLSIQREIDRRIGLGATKSPAQRLTLQSLIRKLATNEQAIARTQVEPVTLPVISGA